MDSPVRTSVPASLGMRSFVIPTLIYVALVAITLLSSFGVEASFLSQRSATVFIVGAAMLKSTLVIHFFMGVGQAYKVVRGAIVLWAIILGAVLTIYALAAT